MAACSSVVGEFSHACRALIRRPASSLLVAATLALGIGASTAIYSVVDAVRLRGLPYRDPGSLVVVFADGTARGQQGRLATTPGDFIDWRERASGFDALAALRNESRRITSVETPIVPLVHAVSANYFDVLGVTPIVGRGFAPGEDIAGRNRVVVLSFGLWTRIFGSDRSIVGQTIDLDSVPHTVVGVLPRDFYTAHLFSVQPDLWVPTPFADQRADRTNRELLVYGRLARGAAIGTVQQGLTSLAGRLAAEHPDTNQRWGIRAVPIGEHVSGSFTQTAALLLGAAGLVVLIACANAASLALARGAERATEMAVRVAMGASRGRLVASVAIESLVLALAGGLTGALVAAPLVGPVVHLIPTSAGVPFLERAGLDGRVWLAAVTACVLTAAICAVLPARQALRVEIVGSMRRDARSAVGATSRRLRSLLVALETALAVVIVSAAGLLWASDRNVDARPVGFDLARIAKLRTSLRGDLFATGTARIAHFAELQRRLRELPGVTSVSAVSFEPLSPGIAGGVNLVIPGLVADPAAPPAAIVRPILPDYLETMGIPLRRGRTVTADDRADSPPVAVVSESFARRSYPGRDPVSRTFAQERRPGMPITIVGVAADVAAAPFDASPLPLVYVPYAQQPLPVMTVVLRTAAEPSSVLAGAERAAWSVSPSTNVYAVETMAQYAAAGNWRARFGATLFGVFAALSLALAAAGVYATVSYAVAQSRREVGLRVALGAGPSAIMAGVLADSLRPIVIGIGVGVPVALLVARMMAGLLFGLPPWDVPTLACASIILVATGTAASLVPAVRAAMTDPTQLLR